MINRSIAPDLKNIHTLDLPKVSENNFNNITAFSLAAGTQPVVKLEVLFPFGGSYHEQKISQSFLTLAILKEGTKSYPLARFNELLAFYGAYIDVSPSFDYPSISLYVLSKHLKNVLPIFSEIIYEPLFAQENFDRLKQIQLQNLKAKKQKNSIVASKMFRNALFGNNHPYGKLINEEAISNITLNDIIKFHKSNLSEFELLITADKITSTTISSIFKYFSNNIKTPPRPTSPIHPSDESQPKNIYLEKPNSVQTSIRLGKLMPIKGSDKYFNSLITSHILGGYFGSRLMKTIREEKGYTYGIHSSIVALKYSSYLTIASDVIKASKDDAIASVKSEIQKLQQGLITDSELALIKNHMLGQFTNQMNSPFSLMSKFKNIHIYSLDYSYYSKYLSSIYHITSQTIIETSNQLFSPEDLTLIEVG